MRALGLVTAQCLAPLLEVLVFGRVFGKTVERQAVDFSVGHRDLEAGPEGKELILIQLFLLVGNVLALAAFSEAVPLDGFGENDGGAAGVLNGLVVGCKYLLRVMSSAPQSLKLLVGHVLDEFKQVRILAKEILSNVTAGLDNIFLVLAVHDLAHTAHKCPVFIPVEKRVPVIAPDDLDDIPSGSAEGGLQFLDNFAVTPHGPVQALQVAVDDENEVVEILARRQRHRAQ